MANTAAATTISMSGEDLHWEGAATADGDAQWPYMLVISFDGEFGESLPKTGTASLSSEKYFGSWPIELFPMSSHSSVFYESPDSLMSLELFGDFSEGIPNSGFADIVTDGARFEWFHPAWNDVAPVSALVARGDPKVVEDVMEPSAAVLLLLGCVVASRIFGRPIG